jgi:magnesium transporter
MEPRPAPAAPVEQSVVAAAIYRDGQRIDSPPTVAETVRSLREQPGTMAWIGLYRPAEAQLLAVAEEFGLHELAVEDAIVAHQRPKLERYGDTLFVVLRAARYLDEVEEVEFGEIHLFVGANFVLTVRHGHAPDLAAVRRRMEGDPELLRLGIYELSREVIEFQRATSPLLGMLAGLMAGFEKYRTDEELQRYLRDVADHATTVAERVDGFRQMLADILTVNATLVNQAQNEKITNLTEASYDQNEEIKRISAWAAILFAPTLIGTVYGMNFHGMPELRWVFGYPFALALMALVSLTLYGLFKRRGWL